MSTLSTQSETGTETKREWFDIKLDSQEDIKDSITGDVTLSGKMEDVLQPTTKTTSN